MLELKEKEEEEKEVIWSQGRKPGYGDLKVAVMSTGVR